jgi:hypothetical protein
VHLDGFITKKKPIYKVAQKKGIHTAPLYWWVKSVYIFWATLCIYIYIYIYIIMRHIFYIAFQGPVSEEETGVEVIFHAEKKNSVHSGLMLTETKFTLSCRSIPRCWMSSQSAQCWVWNKANRCALLRFKVLIQRSGERIRFCCNAHHFYQNIPRHKEEKAIFRHGLPYVFCILRAKADWK